MKDNGYGISYYRSPIGILEIHTEENSLRILRFRNDDYFIPGIADSYSERVISVLDEYFRGAARDFSLEIEPEGTEFQKSVWNELQRIPYGTTCSYLELAQRLGNEKAIRAAARANAMNPIAILIPCHRVIGRDGSLTGYAGGLWRKEWLLAHEYAVAGSEKQLELFSAVKGVKEKNA